MECSKERVLNANVKLKHLDLVIQEFGNVSARHLDECLIKPSGVDLNLLEEENIVSVHIENGKFSGKLKPSSDTPSHLELYRSFKEIGGISHTHSLYATAWAQATKPIPCLGTTHADYWKGDIPVTRALTNEEINGEYEFLTGKVIVETLQGIGLDPSQCPGILVAHHGPFTWGTTVEEAVLNAERLEYIAKLAWMTLQINSAVSSISTPLHQRHFSRKHGPKAYYGQQES